MQFDNALCAIMNKRKKVNNTTCCVPQCSSKASSNSRLSFHQFPKEKHLRGVERRKEWIRVLKIERPVTGRMVVCSKHFQKQDYILPDAPTKRPHLKNIAVPSLCLPTSLTGGNVGKTSKRNVIQQFILPNSPKKIRVEKIVVIPSLCCEAVLSPESKVKETNEEIIGGQIYSYDWLNRKKQRENPVSSSTTANTSASATTTAADTSPAATTPEKPAPQPTPPRPLPQPRQEKGESPVVISRTTPPIEDISQINSDGEEYEAGGRRIVNINYFFQQLKQLSRHRKATPSCSLNTMAIVSETRRGLATEVKFKCTKCNFEKCVWTEDVSMQLPIDLNSAAVTGTVGIKNGLSAMEDFLDILNAESVSINTSYAAKNKRSTSREAKNQSNTKQEDDVDDFTIVVKGKWVKKPPKTPQPKVCLEKQPQVFMTRELDTKPVTSSDKVVAVDPNQVMGLVRAQKSPERILPDASEPGPSKRRKLSSPTMEQDAHMAMTCETYPTDASPPDSLSRVKEEPIDPDGYNLDHAPLEVTQGVGHLPNEPSLTRNQKESLFHPPVLIKEEPVELEEET